MLAAVEGAYGVDGAQRTARHRCQKRTRKAGAPVQGFQVAPLVVWQVAAGGAEALQGLLELGGRGDLGMQPLCAGVCRCGSFRMSGQERTDGQRFEWRDGHQLAAARRAPGPARYRASGSTEGFQAPRNGAVGAREEVMCTLQRGNLLAGSGDREWSLHRGVGWGKAPVCWPAPAWEPAG